MTTVRSDHLYFDGDDVGALGALISERTGITSDGSPWWIEPEPNEVEKRRFRPDREVLTGYMATLSFLGPGKRHPDGAIVCHVMFDQPAEGPELTDTTVTGLLGEHGVVVPSGWTIHTDIGTGFWTEALDVRTTSPVDIATFVFGALRALGAVLPTNRWRVTDQWLE